MWVLSVLGEPRQEVGVSLNVLRPRGLSRCRQLPSWARSLEPGLRAMLTSPSLARWDPRTDSMTRKTVVLSPNAQEARADTGLCTAFFTHNYRPKL